MAEQTELNIPNTAVSVLIVGAGPTGLTLACDLARRGVSCRVIDKAAEYFDGSRGKGLQPRTLEVFDDLGMIESVLAAGTHYPRFRAYMWRFAFHWDMHKRRSPTPDVPYPNTWLIPQWRTEAILRDRLAQYGMQVALATELTSFMQDDGGVTAMLDHSGVTERVRTSYLVGADGGHSFVRKALGISFAGETFENERMLVGDVRVDGLDREHWHVWPRATGGVIALCPLPGTNMFQFIAQVAPSTAMPELTEKGIQSFFATAVKRHTGIRIHTPTWLSVYRPNVRMVNRYRVGRIFLAGDAAHVHPPAGGQGLNTGVQDAYNLGWKLGQVLAGAPVALLDSYEEERMPVASDVLGISNKLYRQAADNSTWKQRRGVETQQLGINYRGSTLACDDRTAHARLRAGDRAPDAFCHDATGARIRLFDAFRGSHLTLLAFGQRHSALVAAVNARYKATIHAYVVHKLGNLCAGDILVDTHGQAYRAYGIAADTLVLVRPDGYIGLITHQQSIEAVSNYLSQMAGNHSHCDDSDRE